jgi:hypothetical protein
MRAALIRAAATVAFAAVAESAKSKGNCFDEYQCIFHRWIDDNTEYSWDLYDLCRCVLSETLQWLILACCVASGVSSVERMAEKSSRKVRAEMTAEREGSR